MEEENKTYNMNVVNRNIIKECARGLKVSKEYEKGLDEMVKKIIKKSALRANGNRRSTILLRDL